MAGNKSMIMFQLVEGRKDFTASVPGVPFAATAANYRIGMVAGNV